MSERDRPPKKSARPNPAGGHYVQYSFHLDSSRQPVAAAMPWLLGI
jgi:hypothetical protein